MAVHGMRRIESLSHGMLSIAMTLLVLNLRALLPSIGGYVLGFLSLGIFWVCQCTPFTYLARSDRRLA